MERFAEYRKLIDDIDDKIVDLLDQRLSVSKEIAKNKSILIDLKRESEIVERLCKLKHRSLSSQHIKWIYNIIFQITKEEMRNVF